MLDKLLDLFLKTPAAKRIARALVDRALIAGVAVVLSWLQLDPEAAQVLNADLLEIANTLAPWIVTALFAWMAVKKSKRTELTIETARLSPEAMPRDVIDHTVSTLLKSGEANHILATRDDGQPRYQGAATQWGRGRPRAGQDLTQKVPPGTVDRTD